MKCEEDYLKNWQEIVNIVGIRNCFIELAGSDKIELAGSDKVELMAR